jgi:hypothetical protein
MKKFLLLITLSLFTVAGFSQSTFYTRNLTEKFQKAVTTTSATATHIDSTVIAANEAGIFELRVIGYNEANSTTYIGFKRFNYKKVAGIDTIAFAALDSSVVTGIGSANFTFTATAGNNLQVKVVGAASTTVKWISINKQYFRRLD